MSPHRYRYIIVGAGAAGCVLANRLSADPDASVLLLEAGGPDRSPLIHVPAGFAKLMGTKVNWLFDTVPQRHLNGRRIFLPQGKVLGGSTAINAMLYIRGHRSDYDGWRDLGNEGWSYDDVLPYFKQCERNERLADDYHGTAGELNVADLIGHNPLSAAFVRAVQELGVPYTADPNGAQQAGVFYHQVTQRKARRESAATAFLNPAKQRPNLTVQTSAQSTRILIRHGRAAGVEYVRAGQTRTALADGEVIVSAGAINSPRLLLLSGIGPAAELETVGVPVVHDLPGVGKNLHDQLEVYLTSASTPVSYAGQDRGLNLARHALQYGLYRTGPATATAPEAGAFVTSPSATGGPNIQLHFLAAYVVWPDGAHRPGRVPGHGFTILANDARPRSRGEVTLRSFDPFTLPNVDPNYLDDPADWAVAVEALRWAREILNAPAFSSYARGERMPGREVQSDDELRRYIAATAKTDYHPVGTCKMGTDELAVVDPQLRVRGLDALRVIDSSIMPSIIGGNTQAPVMMIAAKGAAMIAHGASVGVVADADGDTSTRQPA